MDTKTILEGLKFLCDWAYEQGAHELGYDPLEELKTLLAAKDKEIQALTTDVEQLRIYIDQIQ